MHLVSGGCGVEWVGFNRNILNLIAFPPVVFPFSTKQSFNYLKMPLASSPLHYPQETSWPEHSVLLLSWRRNDQAPSHLQQIVATSSNELAESALQDWEKQKLKWLLAVKDNCAYVESRDHLTTPTQTHLLASSSTSPLSPPPSHWWWIVCTNEDSWHTSELSRRSSGRKRKNCSRS